MPGTVQSFLRNRISIITLCLSAQFTFSQSPTLTWDKALEQSLANSTRTAAESATILLAQAQARTVPSPYHAQPELRLTQNDRWNGNDEQEYALRFRTTNPWILKAQKQTHLQMIQLAETQLETRKWQIRHQTRLLYFEALYRQKVQNLTTQWEAALREHLAWNESLLEVGQQTLPQVLEIRVEANEASRTAQQAKLDHQIATTRLLVWIDQLPEKEDTDYPNLTTPFSTPQADLSLNSAKQLYQHYLRNHPLPNTFAQQKQISQLKILETQEGNKPWVNFVQAGFRHESNSWQGEDWRLRIGIQIPLFKHKNTLRDAALAEQNLSRAQLEAHLLEARLQIAEKLTNLQFRGTHLTETQKLTSGIIEQVEATLHKDADAPAPTLQPGTRYRLKRGLHRIQREFLDAQYAYQTAKLELDYYSVGGEK